MQTQDYEQAVFDILEDLREYRNKCGDRFRFSDILQETEVDGEPTTLQYVNLVQEGGGVLGIALVGFTYVLEEMGIRFLSLGGTSAGSINTLLMADAGAPEEKKSRHILDRIASKRFSDFVDGGSDARRLTELIQSGVKFGSAANMASNMPSLLLACGNLPEVFNDFGINPGDHFEDWLSQLLNNKSWQALSDNLRNLPENLMHVSDFGNKKHPIGVDELEPKIAIVAADITTQTKVEFPRMAGLYYERPENQDPACFVRASMSIPFFFTPKRVSLSWTEGRENEIRRRWRKLAGYSGELPEEILFVDGGVMSNFPIDLFHQADTVPQRPTIGVKLGVDRKHASKITSLGQFLGSMQEGVRNLRDLEFIRNNPEYKDLVEYIDVEGFSWINFNISDAEKMRLFRRGAEAASNFLRRFNWLEYKSNIKTNLLQRIKPVLWELSNIKDLDHTLEAFGIRDNEDVKNKIAYLKEREKPYNVLWIDDKLTYPLPMAILDRLHTYCYTMRTSDEAQQLLIHNNRVSDDPNDWIDLIISDVTRDESEGDEHTRGIGFAAMLAHDPVLKDIPVLFYAHRRSELEERYGQELPKNVVNHEDRYTIMHGDFIAEVVDAIYARARAHRSELATQHAPDGTVDSQ
ncbi:putative acylesterase/phospholipase RssA [Lewinella aquimaris]|uniref:Putative acylesterase/phospholipase RssA n=1 Tax=Neolewinella aquimaris TaxID=1835722 RepID=A0A840EHA5_9BACT|nr:patatin-like phospholipase family protein [Neolewinella aquimaris]MBB4080286.1 putative acylesterase/phospholipase RssA [Neolewinella aquimaris]